MKNKIYYKCVQCGAECFWTIDGKSKTHTCRVCGVENPYKILEVLNDKS